MKNCKRHFLAIVLCLGCQHVLQAQSDDTFCRTLQAMLAETKTGFPSFRGEAAKAGDTTQYYLNAGLIEGSDFRGGRVYVYNYRMDKQYQAMVRENSLWMYTKAVGTLTYTQADTALIKVFEQYVVNIWQGCFPQYVIKAQKLDEVDRMLNLARVVVSKKPVLNAVGEFDQQALLDEPYITFSIEKNITGNEASIHIRFKCLARKAG